MRSTNEILIGVSSCLLGERVRYDGGHKHDAYLTGALARLVRFVPVCPEVEVGMGVPRETVRLELRGDDVHMIATDTGADHTAAMKRYAHRRVAELEKLGLSGYVFKRSSPSCGVFRVSLHRPDGEALPDGRGLFAAALIERLPRLPVEEEGRLNDLQIRAAFLDRVYSYHGSRR